MKGKLQNLTPLNRHKRGLINGLGNIIKAISGNLDADDAMKYDQAISELTNNQKSIVSKLNEEISLTNKIIDDYNQTLSLIKMNQDTISYKLNEINSNLNRLIFNFTEYLKIKDVLDQIQFMLGMIEQILTDLENSVTFSHLNTLNFKIINNDDMKSIIQTAENIYGPEKLAFPLNLEYLINFYEITETASYFSNNKITFVIKLPIVSPENFNYYHFYPVPNINNTIIIPPYPYVLTDGKEYLGMTTPCRNYNNWFYCNSEEHIIKDNCFKDLLELKSSANCDSQQVTLQKEKLEIINNQNYIFIFPIESKITEICETTQTINLQGSYLITLQPGCSVTTQENMVNAEFEEIGNPIILPAISVYQNKTSTLVDNPIELDDIQLDRLKELRPIQQLQLHNSSWIPYTFPIFSTILLVLIIGTITWIYRKYTRLTATPPENSEVRATPSTSVFFVPNKP